MTLRDLKEGDRALITGIRGDSHFNERLSEMGFISGTEVFVEKYAPLRDPMEIIIKGYHLALRRSDAEHIDVDPLPRQLRRRRRLGWR